MHSYHNIRDQFQRKNTYNTQHVKLPCGDKPSKLVSAGTTLVAGYEDGCVKVWDLKTASAMHTIQGKISLGSFNGLYVALLI